MDLQQQDNTDLSNEILMRLGAILTAAKEDQIFVKCLNPEHDDSHPSMSVSLSKGVCHCFSCNYAKKLTSVYFDLTGHSIYKDLGIARTFQFRRAYNDPAPDFSMLPETDFVFKGNLSKVDTSESSLAWVKKRGFNPAFCSRNNIYFAADCFTYKKSDPQDKKSQMYLKNEIIIPIYEQGKLISFEARDTEGKEAWENSLRKNGKDPSQFKYKKVLYPKHSSINTIYEYDKLDKNEPLYITEGLMDMFSLRTEKEFKNSSCLFHNTPTERQLYLLRSFKEIIYVTDNDLPGLRGCKVMMERMPGKVSFIRPPQRKNIKDINDILQGKDGNIKSVADLLRMGWLKTKSSDIEELISIIALKEKES